MNHLRNVCRFVVAGVAALVLLVSVPAEESKPEPREWTSTAGTKMTATLESVRGDTVILKMAAGKAITVKLGQLSQADRDFVKAEQEKMTADKTAAEGVGADSGKGGTPLADKWYEERPGMVADDKTVVQNFSLKAGESRRFEVAKLKGDYPMISFSVDIGSELHGLHGKDHKIKMEQVGGETMAASNIGGGTGFEHKGGKVKLKLTNHSDQTVRIVVKVDTEDLEEEK